MTTLGFPIRALEGGGKEMILNIIMEVLTILRNIGSIGKHWLMWKRLKRPGQENVLLKMVTKPQK
ncbi:hypothetical protein BD809_102189 [Aquimarina intermedia]|uniref:Uncharacterized protein n=1 Tax=Aquimarina intermedia TaxID=350814 RepID=A0A5S5CCB5_9FLAO|nr:hypothetical protein BD809_102189 [Aquimarina intermedia]